MPKHRQVRRLAAYGGVAIVAISTALLVREMLHMLQPAQFNVAAGTLLAATVVCCAVVRWLGSRDSSSTGTNGGSAKLRLAGAVLGVIVVVVAVVAIVAFVGPMMSSQAVLVASLTLVCVIGASLAVYLLLDRLRSAFRPLADRARSCGCFALDVADATIDVINALWAVAALLLKTQTPSEPLSSEIRRARPTLQGIGAWNCICRRTGSVGANNILLCSYYYGWRGQGAHEALSHSIARDT